MRTTRLLAVRFTVFALGSLVAATLTFAITNGPLDGNNHPSLGFVFGQQSDPNTCNAEIAEGCTAILVSPTVAISSGGCVENFGHPELHGFNLSAVWISFNGDDPFDCSAASRVLEFHTHPLFDETQLDLPSDFGVFILAAPAAVAPATLPAADSQGGHVNSDDFEIVDWGIDAFETFGTYRRRVAPARFMSNDADFLKIHLTLNGSQICIGSTEGGGAFLPASQSVVAMIHSSDNNYKVTSFLPKYPRFLG